MKTLERIMQEYSLKGYVNELFYNSKVHSGSVYKDKELKYNYYYIMINNKKVIDLTISKGQESQAELELFKIFYKVAATNFINLYFNVKFENLKEIQKFNLYTTNELRTLTEFTN
tara:strand:- start:377 stop:721 length:345 start_codon:yes stop_codon:yes gene_type:complete